MATFDFQSVIEFGKIGNSINFNNEDATDSVGTLDDGENVGAGSTTFESGDQFTFTIPAGGVFSYPAGDIVTLEYAGTYTTGLTTYVVLQDPLDTDVGFFFSDVDAATASADLDNVVSTTDPEWNAGDFTTCFAAGTLIATPDGEQPVETLKIGDTITTADGKTVVVKWLGWQTVHKIFTSVEWFVPVRVAAGALGDGLPHTDLVLTPAHALIIDDLAIDAGALVNGTTITYDPIESLPDRVTYYHIETEEHDVILANGAPAETFVDHAGRRAFDNFAEYLALYGDERPIHEMNRPRVSAARLVPPDITARLAGRKVA